MTDGKVECWYSMMEDKRRDMYQLKSYGVQPPYQSQDTQGERWTLKNFKKNFQIEIKSSTDTEMEFDMINVNCALANTLRRILLVEVPTMAIEKVFIYQNTSMIQDEVLAQRLGLIPLDVDPRLFNHLSSAYPETDTTQGLSQQECLFFDLDVKCTRETSSGGCRSVYAHEMRWVPIGNQAETFEIRPPKPVRLTPNEPGILLAKLAPGQEISLRCLAVKGMGKDHAKFSPVATATYRMHPRIALTRPVDGDLALKLQECFPKGVIEVNRKTGQARVANERLEVRNSRKALLVEELQDVVTLGLDSSHFIFTVESTGAMTPADIVEQAFRILIQKCDVIDIALSAVD